MSYDRCKYCIEPAFKTDGNGDFICFNKAETGDCNTFPLKEKHDYVEPKIRKRPSVDIKSEYELIQQKKSTLSRSDREWVIEQFNLTK